MNTKKIFKCHKKFRKYFNNLFKNEKPVRKISLYKKLLKIIEKLKNYEYIGKISYLTPLSDIETMLENDKVILEEKLKTKQDRFL